MRGKYSVPTRDFAAGQVGARGRNAASGRGVAIAGPSPTLPAFSFSFFFLLLFFFFSAFPSSFDGSDRWWSRGPERHPSDRECPAGTPARSLPSAPGRCFSPFLLPMAGPGRASRGENPQDDRFSPGRRRVADVRDVRWYGTYIPPAPLVPSLRVKRAPKVCRTYTYCLLVTETDSPRGAEPSEKSAS